MYAAPTVALFERDATGRPHLRAIAVADDVFQPHDGDSWELAKLFVLQGAGHHMVMGYGGIPGNSAYPAWRYSPAPEPIVGDYGIFLDHYYDAIVEFTRVVAATVPAGDEHVAQWATRFPLGTVIVRQGDPAEAFYMSPRGRWTLFARRPMKCACRWRGCRRASSSESSGCCTRSRARRRWSR